MVAGLVAVIRIDSVAGFCSGAAGFGRVDTGDGVGLGGMAAVATLPCGFNAAKSSSIVCSMKGVPDLDGDTVFVGGVGV